MVLRSVFEESARVEELGANGATMSADAALTGNFSLELPSVGPTEHQVTYRLFVISEEGQGAALCTVCLWVAGR